jgi:hypothetical protein
VTTRLSTEALRALVPRQKKDNSNKYLTPVAVIVYLLLERYYTMSEGSLPTDDPFVDPSIYETPSALQGEATLFVTEDASLTLGADATIILGMSRVLLAIKYSR